MVGGVIGKNIQGTQNFQRERAKSMTVPIARNLMLKNAPTLPGGIGSEVSQAGRGETKAVNRETQDDDFDIVTDEDTDYDSEDYEAEMSGVVRNDAKALKKKNDGDDLNLEDDEETDYDTEDLEVELRHQVEEESGTKEKNGTKDSRSGRDEGRSEMRARSRSEPVNVTGTNSKDDVFSEIIDEDDEETGDDDFQPQDLPRSSSKEFTKTELKTLTGTDEETESDTTEDENGPGNNIQPKKEWFEEHFDRAEQRKASPQVKAGNQKPEVVVEEKVPERPQLENEAFDEVEIEMRIGIKDDGKILNDDVKKPFKDRVREKLADAFSKLKTGFDNFKFFMSDLLNKKQMDRPSTNVTEARLDRKHAFLDKPDAYQINAYNKDGLERFTKVKWTGNVHEDSKIYNSISNKMTHLEKNIRGALSDKEAELQREFGKDLNSARRRLSVQKGDLGRTVQLLEGQISQSKDEDYKKKLGVKLEKSKLELAECTSKLERLKLDDFPSKLRLEYVQNIVAKSREIYLSEVSVGDLEILARKFRNDGHESKASFVDNLIQELGRRPVTASKEQLQEMRKDRDEEIEANFTPSIEYDAVTAFGQIKGTPTQISLSLNKMLRDFARDQADPGKNPDGLTLEAFIDQKMKKIVITVSSHELGRADVVNLGNVAKELRSKGQEDRAKLLDIFISKINWLRSPDGAREHYLPLVKRDLAIEKGPGTFLRNSNDPLAVAIGNMMNAIGMNTYREKVLKLVVDICKDLKGDKPTDELKQLVKQNKDLKSWGKGEGFPPELAEKIMEFSREFFQAVSMLEMPEDVQNMFNLLSDEIMKRGTANEGEVLDENDRRLTPKQKNEFVHKLFADQVVLKVISPILTIDLIQQATDPDVRSMLGIFKLVAGFSQDVANQSNLDAPNPNPPQILPEGVDGEVIDPIANPRQKLANDIYKGAVQLADIQDGMFMNFGMRPEATSQSIRNLPVYELTD
ncbi:MAG: hypothetical protein RLZZ444_1207 [Pseudomonadota bacterium]